MSSTWASLSQADKKAFYSILDEYFESRPHLFQSTNTSNNINTQSALTHLATTNPAATSSALQAAGLPPSLAKPSNVSHFAAASKHLNGIGSRVGQFTGKFNQSTNSDQPALPSSTTSSTNNGQRFIGGMASHQNDSKERNISDHVRSNPAPKSSIPNHHSFAPPPVRRTPAAPPPIKAKPTDPNDEMVEALYDYDGTSPEDLSFKKHQVIKVTEHISDDWWNGQIGNGPIGMFPSSYVRSL
ncbi:hypothetical protein O181_050723 [Austropuccinia psidii MF-1]|uniref:SH3 domain-containing protein n=1 Tax=Austropuccinia psidii MF-1 TaxID=1389203 RepID=A0A9Q3DZM4_9BASI|nr:hypothetical protein [Austropuccinia psidii MF-1]